MSFVAYFIHYSISFYFRNLDWDDIKQFLLIRVYPRMLIDIYDVNADYLPIKLQYPSIYKTIYMKVQYT